MFGMDFLFFYICVFYFFSIMVLQRLNVIHIYYFLLKINMFILFFETRFSLPIHIDVGMPFRYPRISIPGSAH
jgi:hypothetical protein